MIKRLILVVLSMLMMVSSVTGFAATADDTVTGMRMKPLIDKYQSLTQAEIDTQAARFPDISGHYAKPFVARMTAINIIAGYPEGTFGPNDTLLACHFLTMLVKALGFTPEVPRGQAYWKPYVDIALQEGLVYEGEIADYTGPLTRELAAVIATRALMQYEPAPAELYYDYNTTKMSDFGLVTDKYKQGVVLAYRMGLFMGSNNLFEPKGTFTRAQGAIIINKLLDKSLRVESVPNPSEAVSFTSYDFNEYFFPGSEGTANKTYTFYPGEFPLPEIFDVVKAHIQSKSKLTGGFIVQGFQPTTQFFKTELYRDQATADKFYKENPNYPTMSTGLFIYTDKATTKGAINDQSSGFLYDINVTDVSTYNACMKEYVHEVFKTLFGPDAAEAIRIHDEYLALTLAGEPFQQTKVFLNYRKVRFVGGVGSMGPGMRVEIWARGAIN
jgi:hypothetical protein